jgi:hypothetical protein
MFFSQQVDDSWFRSLYSPVERFRIALQEKDRAIHAGLLPSLRIISITSSPRSSCQFLPVHEIPPHVTDD